MSPSPNAGPAAQALTRELGAALRLPLGVAAAAVAAAPCGVDAASLLQPPAHPATAPAQLARSHAGPAARAAAQAMYRRCLVHFRQHTQEGAALDDSGLAAACFVLTNLDALHALHPDAAVLARVRAQLQQALVATTGWAQAPLQDRQSAFEQLAILSVLVAESTVAARRQGAAALAHVQQAARGYLVQWLGLNPDRLTLGPHGLALAAS